MNALAEIQDVERRLARALTTPEQLRVEYLLTDASARFRSESGQTFTVVEDDVVVLPVRGGRVRLPQRPVTEVASVTDGTNPVLHSWDNGEFLTITNLSHPFYAFAFEPFRTPRDVVTVTYTHGGTIPDLVVATVCQMAARAFGSPADESGITQENIDGYGYSRGSAAASGATGMLPSELEVARSYRRVDYPISMHAS